MAVGERKRMGDWLRGEKRRGNGLGKGETRGRWRERKKGRMRRGRKGDIEKGWGKRNRLIYKDEGGKRWSKKRRAERERGLREDGYVSGEGRKKVEQKKPPRFTEKHEIFKNIHWRALKKPKNDKQNNFFKKDKQSTCSFKQQIPSVAVA